MHVHFLLALNHQTASKHKSVKNIRYNTCTENRGCVHLLLSLKMLYAVCSGKGGAGSLIL